MTPFEQEYRWHQQQARLMEQDRRVLAHERFYVPSDEEVAEELKRREVAQEAKRRADSQAPLNLEGMTLAEVSIIVQELYRDCTRLRAELDAVQGVIR
jgi:hypothetical protein